MKSSVTGWAAGILLCLFVSIPSVKADTISQFDTGTDGWRARVWDGENNVWASAPFTPGWNSDGYLSLADSYANQQAGNISTPQTYWTSSSSFSGNHLGAYGLSLEFDLKDIAFNPDGTPFLDRGGNPLLFMSNSTQTLGFYYVSSIFPGADWTHFSVSMMESGWRIRGTGAVPTADQFKSVLSSMSGIAILAEFVPYHEDTEAYSLDNVVLHEAPVPEPATMLLLGSGLVGLAGMRRRFKKS